MAFDAFIKIGDIEGEAVRKGFEGQIEIMSFSLGASNPTTIGSGGGGGAGKATLSSLNVMKMSDKASPVLFQNCCQGKHFPKATVTLHKAGGEEAVDYLVYELEHVFIESIQWSGSSGGDDRPAENLSLAFGKITVTYKEQTETGAMGSPIVGTWNALEVTT